MLLDVNRYKGSTGAIKLTWVITLDPNVPASLNVSAMFGQLEFCEGQWNSSIHLRFPFILARDQEISISVKLHNVSSGAMLGNFTRVKITFPANVYDNSDNTGFILKILLPCLIGALLIFGITAAIIFFKGKKK